MNSSKNLVVFGWYGAGNVGDELLLKAFVEWAKQRGAAVTAISIDPEYTSLIHGIRSVDFNDLDAIATAMRDADLFALGGGGLLQTHHSLTISAMYDFAKPDVAIYCRMLALATQFELKTLFWAQGVGPLETSESRALVAHVAKSCDFISVRDEESRALLREIGVSKEIECAPDPVWALDLAVSRAGLTRIPKRVAVVVRPWSSPSWRKNFLDGLLRTLGGSEYTLVWVPYQVREVAGRSASDLSDIHGFIDGLGDAFRHEIISVDRPEDALRGMSDCAGVIAMRLHAQILALRMRMPVMTIEYDRKMALTSVYAELDAGFRVDEFSTPDAWLAAFGRLRDVMVDGLFSASDEAVGGLEHRSFLQRDLLWRAIDESSRRSGWTPGQYDWYGSWSAQRSQRIIEDQAYFLRNLSIKNQSQLDQLLAQNSAHQSQIKEVVQELRAELNETRGRLEQLSKGISRIATRSAQALGITLADPANGASLVDVAISLADRASEIAKESGDAYSRLQRESLLTDARIINAEREINHLRRELQVIHNSKSWWLTKPIRSMGRLMRDPSAEIRLWRARAVHHIEAPSVIAQVADATSLDLTWSDFQARVLADTSSYTGIFIQEVVIDWNVPLYQRPQHISVAMAKLGYLVIYRTVNWSGDNVNGFREVLPNVWLSNQDEVDTIKGAVRSVYSTGYVNSPRHFKEIGKGNVMMYEYIDHIDPQISGDPDNIKRLLEQKEWAFSGGADVIVASAAALEKEAVEAVGGSKVISAKNGVDTGHYRNPIHADYVLPNNLKEFRSRYKKVVGYFGAIAPWLWYEGLSDLVAQREDCGFLFIGPDYYGGVEKLPNSSNVLYLGAIDYKVLPAYARTFDVCIIPFEKGEIARTTSPLKLFEYFALEKPVVVTEWMDECVAHPEVYRGGTVQQLSEALSAALSAKDDERLRVRFSQMADENSWESRAKAMTAAFDLLPR